jgi:hypothetical protein
MSYKLQAKSYKENLLAFWERASGYSVTGYQINEGLIKGFIL